MLKVEYLLKISRMSDVYMPTSGPLFSTSTQLQARNNYRVEAIRLPGETENDARERLKVIVEDSEQRLAMEFRRLREVVLRFLKR